MIGSLMSGGLFRRGTRLLTRWIRLLNQCRAESLQLVVSRVICRGRRPPSSDRTRAVNGSWAVRRQCSGLVTLGAGRVVVVGGGVGGLTAAIALVRVGVEVRVLERAPELREVGAGIGLWANAIHVFERLGLGATVRGLGGESLGGAVLTRHGRRLTSQPAAISEARPGAPTIAVLRSDLQALLLSELPGETIGLGAEVTGLEMTGGRVELSLIDGDVISADLVVGADGLRSVVRAHLVGDGPPRYRGYTAWHGSAARGSRRGPRWGLRAVGAGGALRAATGSR